MSVYFETQQNVTQSTPMADFSFGLLKAVSCCKRPKTFEVSARRLDKSYQQKELNEFIKHSEGTDIIKLSSQYFSTGHNFV